MSCCADCRSFAAGLKNPFDVVFSLLDISVSKMVRWRCLLAVALLLPGGGAAQEEEAGSGAETAVQLDLSADWEVSDMADNQTAGMCGNGSALQAVNSTLHRGIVHGFTEGPFLNIHNRFRGYEDSPTLKSSIRDNYSQSR